MTTQDIKKALQEYFSPNGENKRFFDATQIHRICEDIKGIHESIKGIQESTADLGLIRKVVYGAIGMILVAFFTSVIYLVIKK